MPAAFARALNTQKEFFSQVAWLLLAPVHVRAWQQTRRQGMQAGRLCQQRWCWCSLLSKHIRKLAPAVHAVLCQVPLCQVPLAARSHAEVYEPPDSLSNQLHNSIRQVRDRKRTSPQHTSILQMLQQ
jgi:hypothetical protein